MSKKENKDLNIKELLKENEIKTLKDLDVLFGKMKKINWIHIRDWI